MPTDEREHAFLLDVLTEANDIGEFILGKNFADFASDKLLHKAVIKSLESVAEATKNIKAATKEKHPQVEWSKIARFRDKIAHHYWEVDYAQVWEVVKGPHLRALVEAVTQEIDSRK